MSQSIKQRTGALASKKDAEELRKLLEANLADMTAVRDEVVKLVADATAITAQTRNHLITDPALAIGGGAKTTAQATKAFLAVAGGTTVYKAAATAMPNLGGAATAANMSTAWAFYIDSAGTITVSDRVADAASAAAAITAITAVAIPTNKALIGYLVVTMSGGATFTPNTTALDAANTAVVYLSAIGLAKDTGAQTAAAPAALTTIA